MALIRFAFHLLYHQLAWTYDLVSWLVSLGEWRAWQEAALPFLPGQTVLELAHGPGHMLEALQSDASRFVVGLDLSPQMGRLAYRRLQRAGQPVRLAQARVQQLPYATNTFDAILSTFPTDYILDPETLAEVVRVLAENGRFVIVPEAHLTGRGPLQRLIAWLFRVTGQRSGATVDAEGAWENLAIWRPFRQRFAAAGLHLSVQQLRRPRSAVTIMIAAKKEKRGE